MLVKLFQYALIKSYFEVSLIIYLTAICSLPLYEEIKVFSDMNIKAELKLK